MKMGFGPFFLSYEKNTWNNWPHEFVGQRHGTVPDHRQNPSL